MRKKTYFSGVLPDLYSVNDYLMMMKMMMLIISMYLRVAFDSFQSDLHSFLVNVYYLLVFNTV